MINILVVILQGPTIFYRLNAVSVNSRSILVYAKLDDESKNICIHYKNTLNATLALAILAVTSSSMALLWTRSSKTDDFINNM